jgi:hypothetical protein
MVESNIPSASIKVSGSASSIQVFGVSRSSVKKRANPSYHCTGFSILILPTIHEPNKFCHTYKITNIVMNLQVP